MKYPDTTIIDIGANIGDSVAIMRSLCQSPILCIEGCNEYIPFLKRNTSQFTNIEIDENYIGEPDLSSSYNVIAEKGTAHIIYNSDNALTNICSFNQILQRHPDFQNAKFWKIDTDGYDTSIIKQGLAEIKGSYPIIHFEYDPYFLDLSGNMNLDIFHVLRSYGYHYALFYENTGDFFAMIDICNETLLEDLHQAQCGRKSERYWDICVFPEEDNDICISLRKSEISLFKKARAVKPKRLLWVRTDAIGDNILAATELEHLKKYYDGAEIIVLCQDRVADIYAACPFVDHLIAFDRIKALSDEAYRKFILDQVIALKPDISLNSVYSREPLTDYFAIECGAEEKLAIDCNLSNISNELREKHNRFYTHVIPSNGSHKSEIERHADFLRGLGIENPALEVNLWAAQEDEHYAQELFRKYDMIPERTIALFAGAHGAHKLSDAYGEAIDEVCKDGNYTVIALGASQDADIISRNLRKINIPSINLCGQTNLRQSAAILAQCRLGIGADTGLAHICCGVGTPNVVLLGGAHFGRFIPYSPLTSIACLPLDCYGCDWQCRYSRAHCVQDVSPLILKEALRQTLAHKSDRPRVFIQPESLWTGSTNGPKWRMLTQSEIPVNCEIILIENTEKESVKDELSHIRVSAIVSTYKSERFMRGCLEDLVNQTLYKKGGLEVIVIDACSPEQEATIVQEFQSRYENIRYIRTDERIPLYQAWNIGIQNARGQYISNANTDDRHAPEMLERLADELDRRPDIGLVYADSLVTVFENTSWADSKARGVLRWPEYNCRDLFDVCAMGPHPMWRKDLHDRFGYFDTKYQTAGDYDFWLRLAIGDVNMLHIPEVLGLYLANPTSVSLRDANLGWEESERARSKYWPASWGMKPNTQWRECEVPLFADKELSDTNHSIRHVLIMCDYFWPSVGGVELYVQDLGMHLMQAGYHVEIGARWLPQRVSDELKGIKIHSFRCNGTQGEGGVCLEQQKLNALLMQGKFDVVIALTQPDNWVAQGLLGLPNGHPRIIMLPSINKENLIEWNTDVSLMNVIHTLGEMDTLIAVTENGLDAKVFQAAHLSSVFIPHAVEHDAVSQNFREAFNLDKNRPLLVMVANYWPVKNHLELLQTLDGIEGDWQLILIGNPTNHFPDYHKQVLIQAAKDPRVRVLGGFPREIAASAIRDADILLVPSKGESAGPLVVLQAMSYGTPWIATPECNGVSDEAGGIVAPLSQFPTEIKALLTAPEIRSEIGELGREHWKACFTWAKSLPAFVDIIENRQISSSLTMPADIRVRNTQAIKKLHENSYSDVTPTPVFSIIIPTHNRSDILLKNLDALAKQTYPFDRFEVIVCDDGSTDDTQSALSIYSAPYHLIILHQENMGAAAARNNAIKHAKGDYLLILNDDVIAENDLIEQHLKEHQKQNNMKISVLGDVCTMPKYSERLISQVFDRKSLLFPQANKQEGVEYDHNMFVTANISIRRSLFTEDGFWFDENFPRCMCEDIELGYRLYKHGVKVFFQPAAKVNHDHCLTVADYIRREIDNSTNLIYFISKHPELAPMYLGIPQLQNLPLEQWREYSSNLEAQIPELILQIESIQEKTLADIAGTDILSQEKMLDEVFRALDIIRSYTKVSTILQILEKQDDGTSIPLNKKDDSEHQIQKSSRHLKMNFTSKGVPELTSIIILNLNGSNHIRQCLESIHRCTNLPHEIIVVDNGSEDDSLAYLHSLRDIRLIENPENVGAPLGRNQGLAIAEGEYIVFLDNDTIVTNGWLERFIAHTKKDPALCVLGPRSNYVSGPQLVTNARYQDSMSLESFASNWSSQHEGQYSMTSRLILFCLFVKRETICRIGGIDTVYGKWGWEDDDFGVRAQLAGYRLAIADDVYIHHTGSQTSKTANINYDELLAHNWEVFRTKWNISWSPGQPMQYDLLSIQSTQFDTVLHFVEIPSRANIEKLLYQYSDTPTSADDFNTRKQKAIELTRQQKWVDAIELAQECLSEQPQDWELVNTLSVALLGAGKREKAKEMMQQGATNAPNKIEFCHHLALTFLEEGKTLDALELAMNAVNSEPSRRESHQLLEQMRDAVVKEARRIRKSLPGGKEKSDPTYRALKNAAMRAEEALAA
jgi:FkbM family methyltransferase